MNFLKVAARSARTYAHRIDGQKLEFMKEQLNAGRQAYVVFPRVDNEDTATGINSVTKEARKLAEFTPHQVGVLHGRMKPEEKEQAMQAFNENRLQVFTTVVEVGVDVTNANLMLIQNADQFGLAQLHQLRGRGRGKHDSHCILLTTGTSDEANDRLKVLEETTDGFQTEADLKLRGPGELTGHDQSGLPAFKFGDLRRPRPHRIGSPHCLGDRSWQLAPFL